MDLQKCKDCDHKSNAKDGVCSLKKAFDGLLLRCVGDWSEAKHYYLRRYIEIFTTSMKDKWPGQLYYIDLFSGPGKCKVRQTEEEIDGSPLIALSSPYAFARHFFVDLNEDVLNALSIRCIGNPYSDRVEFIHGDCNSVIDDIIDRIPQRSLSLAFIDPAGLHFKFSTLEKLAQRRVDLIITFPEGMAVKRNFKKFLVQSESLLDNVIGDKGWREFNTGKEIIEYYRKRLSTLEYQEVKLGDEILIRSTSTNQPLYCLLFASKNPLGHKFWQYISKIDHTGQRRLL